MQKPSALHRASGCRVEAKPSEQHGDFVDTLIIYSDSKFVFSSTCPAECCSTHPSRTWITPPRRTSARFVPHTSLLLLLTSTRSSRLGTQMTRRATEERDAEVRVRVNRSELIESQPGGDQNEDVGMYTTVRNFISRNIQIILGDIEAGRLSPL